MATLWALVSPDILAASDTLRRGARSQISGAGFPTPPNRLRLLVAPIAPVARYPLRYWRAVVYPVGYAVPYAVLAGLDFLSLTRHRSNLQDCRTMRLGGGLQ